MSCDVMSYYIISCHHVISYHVLCRVVALLSYPKVVRSEPKASIFKSLSVIRITSNNPAKPNFPSLLNPPGASPPGVEPGPCPCAASPCPCGPSPNPPSPAALICPPPCPPTPTPRPMYVYVFVVVVFLVVETKSGDVGVVMWG